MGRQTNAILNTARGELYVWFSSRWDSNEIRFYRGRLARLLLPEPRNKSASLENDFPRYRSEIVKFIDFFEELGFSYAEHKVDRRMVINTFSDVIVAYWLSVGERYAVKLNENDANGKYYDKFKALAEAMIKGDKSIKESSNIIDTLADELAVTAATFETNARQVGRQQ
jgi:hypothetical protein